MIELLEGVPGSGKSYHAVKTKLLAWVRAGRRVYVYVEGFYLDRLALFEGVDVQVLEQQITLWQTVEDVKAGLLTVEPGSAVFIDEVQTVFRAKEKADPEVLRWLETHRHRGIDIVMMCQQYGQLTLGVNRLVEATTKFRRLDRFGLKNRYQAFVRGNPEELEVIRMFTGRYEPKVYAYYSSYSSGAIRETTRGGSILKSPSIIIGLVGLTVAGWWFLYGGWITGAKVAPVPVMRTATLPPPPPLPVETPAVTVPVPPQTIVPITIQGGMSMFKDGNESWLWVTADGRLLTEDDIAGESGGTVQSRLSRGIRVLSGTGVKYGGQPAESAPVQVASSPYVPPDNPNVTGPPPVVFDPGRPSLLATPPDLR